MSKLGVSRIRYACSLVFVLLVSCVALFCWNQYKMTNLSVRLQNMFENTKAVCFGRFVVDVPQTASVVWGRVSVPLTIWVEKGGGPAIGDRVAEVEARLKSEARFPLSKGLKLYFETVDGVVPGMRHIISQRSFDGEGLLRINSFFAMDDDLVGLQALPLSDKKHEVIGLLNDMARRLRTRTEHEMPAESGACIENAFLLDSPSVKAEEINEHIQVGFRLEEFPDVHFSIHIAPANPDPRLQGVLKEQLEGAEEDARRSGQPNPFRGFTVFRRAEREIHEWKTGFEYLARTPEQDGSHAHHDFWMKFSGVPHDPLRPFADIDFKTGVGENLTGAVKPSLTDDEAIALWDKLTSSIRIRPTTGAKTSQSPLPKVSLGTLHVTGRRCPQAGWWECADELNLAQPSGIWLEQGELMPKARVWAQPNLWDRLKGERPVGWKSAVWRLARYERPPQKG